MYIEVKDLKKSYGTGDSKVQVLRGVTTEVEQGENVRYSRNEWFW